MATTTTEYNVTGMSCGHCEVAIRQEVSQLSGVTGVDVSSKTGRLVITSDQPLQHQSVLDAVDEAGYEATPA